MDEDQYGNMSDIRTQSHLFPTAGHEILGQKAHYTMPDPYQTYYPAELDRAEAMNRTDSEYIPQHYFVNPYDPTFRVSALAYPTEIRGRCSFANGGEMALGSPLDDYFCNRDPRF